MPNKLTDTEVKKALPKVLYGGHGCKDCKYDNGKGDDRCGLKGCKIARYALDLINRYEAENESLKAEVERLQRPQDADPMDFCGVLCNFSEGLIAKAKAEAYKEFVERLRTKLDPTLIAITMIGSVLVEVSKSHISSDNAIEKIREYLKGLEIETRLSFDMAVDNILNELVGDGDE